VLKATDRGAVTRYVLHDLTLEVRGIEADSAREVDGVLHAMPWRVTEALGPPTLTLSIDVDGAAHAVPAGARAILRTDEYSGFEEHGSFYLTDGETVLRVRARDRRGDVHLAPSFSARPSDLRRQFWMYTLVKLLQSAGVHGLHAAGLVAPDGAGLLVVGDSGSGKSTLTIGLIRRGWRYLSDDAVLLRRGERAVEALALRRHFYVDADAASLYPELPRGEEIPDASGGRRRRVGVEEAYPSQRVSACEPRILLFTRIVPREESALISVDPSVALGRLLAQCVRQAFEREATSQHLVVLKQLLKQARFFDLEAGADLHRSPALLERLLTEVSIRARRAS